MNYLILILLSFIISSNNYVIINDESILKWKGSKPTGSHDGVISIKNGNVTIDDYNLISGNIVIDMSSIICTDITNKSTNDYFVKHLKNEDFFGVEVHPTASLDIISSKLVEDNIYEVIANMTIKEITNPIKFQTVIDYDKNFATATGLLEIDRSKYNIKYKSKSWFPDIGDRFIYDIFELDFKIISELKKWKHTTLSSNKK